MTLYGYPRQPEPPDDEPDPLSPAGRPSEPVGDPGAIATRIHSSLSGSPPTPPGDAQPYADQAGGGTPMGRARWPLRRPAGGLGSVRRLWPVGGLGSLRRLSLRRSSLRRLWPAGSLGARTGAVAMVLAVTLAAVIGAALGGSGRGEGRQAAWRGPVVLAVPAPSATAVPAVETVTLSGVGDVIMGSLPSDLPPRGGEGFFDPVREALAADLVMGNLETPLTADTGRVKCGYVTPSPGPGNPSPKPTKVAGCHQFYLPPSYAGHLRAGGFGVMNLANNHTNDMGAQGLANTRAALDAVGIKYTGAPNQITSVEVNGIRVAVLGFAVYSWAQNLNNIPAAVALVRRAAAAADIVVVQMQGGAEGADQAHQRPGHEFFLGEDRGDLMRFSRAVIDAGADVIFGHGPHIMRGMQFYRGRLIAYSLGNFCGYGVLSSTGYLGVGGVLKVTLRKDGTWSGGELVPTEMVRGGLVASDPDRRAISFVDRLSREDFGATAARIGADGTISPPPGS